MNRDDLFLRHIMDEVQILRSMLRGVRKASLRKDPIRQRAVVRCLEVLGEAIKHVSDGPKRRHPDVDWKGLAGLRDRLIHRYFDIDLDIVWDVVRSELPGLERAVARELEDNE